MEGAVWDFSATYLNPLKRVSASGAWKTCVKVPDLNPKKMHLPQYLVLAHIMSTVQSDIPVSRLKINYSEPGLIYNSNDSINS